MKIRSFLKKSSSERSRVHCPNLKRTSGRIGTGNSLIPSSKLDPATLTSEKTFRPTTVLQLRLLVQSLDGFEPEFRRHSGCRFAGRRCQQWLLGTFVLLSRNLEVGSISEMLFLPFFFQSLGQILKSV